MAAVIKSGERFSRFAFNAGVTDDYDHVGLAVAEWIDIAAIRQAIEKYIDGDFIVVAAEHTLVESGSADEKRYGMISTPAAKTTSRPASTRSCARPERYACRRASTRPPRMSR